MPARAHGLLVEPGGSTRVLTGQKTPLASLNLPEASRREDTAAMQIDNHWLHYI